MENYQEILTQIKVHSAQSKVYLLSILPVNKKKGEFITY